MSFNTLIEQKAVNLLYPLRNFTAIMNCSATLWQNIPSNPDPSWIINYLDEGKFSAAHVQLLREEGITNDKLLASILNLAPKTFVSYTKDSSKIKLDTKEHVLMLLALVKHGTEVFGNVQNFGNWLDAANIFLDNRKPIGFLNTISGIRVIDDRLTGMEFGDNI
jgi:hypothetical protein